MTAEPTIIQCPDQPYLAIRSRVEMDGISAFAERLQEVFAWVGAHGLTVAGAPFFKYDVIDMASGMEMEGGVAVETLPEIALEQPGEPGGVLAGVLPGGRYVSVTHVGHPKQLEGATRDLLEWAAERHLEWDMAVGDGGERWGCRLEVYRTDPAVEPDMDNWEVELRFRLAGAATGSTGKDDR